MDFVSVTVKHGTKTLIAQQVLEYDQTQDFRQLFAAAVAEAGAAHAWSREEQQLLQDPANLVELAQLSSSQDRCGEPCCHVAMCMHGSG